MISGRLRDIVKDTEIDGGRSEEAEGLADLEEVDGVDVEDCLQLVRVVRPHVALVSLLGRHVQEIVLRHQLLQLNKQNRTNIYYTEKSDRSVLWSWSCV